MRAGRTTREVVESHLELRRLGRLEEDLAVNYSPEVVVLAWGEGALRGLDGVRHTADVLSGYLRTGRYRYEQLLVEGGYAMLEWSAEGDDVRVRDGVDSFAVHDGRIVCQTIHYTVSTDEP